MENTEIKINQHSAETIYINHPEASYAIFCFNSIGDLFVNSDYGFYGYAWRSYGDDFKTFLSGTNADYIIQKFENNYRNTAGKKIPKYWSEHLKILVETFINQLKKEINK